MVEEDKESGGEEAVLLTTHASASKLAALAEQLAADLTAGFAGATALVQVEGVEGCCLL